MTDDDVLTDAVKKFIATNSPFAYGRIHPLTNFQNALDRGEMRRFVKAFAEEFNVDTSSFRIEQYYGPDFTAKAAYPFLLLFFAISTASFH